jgi:glycosyltransferase involved in cell wall biosynthesis
LPFELEQDGKAEPGTVIDGRTVVGTNGIVVSVSFYVDQSCSGQSIQFGAFEMNDHEGDQAEFIITAESGPLIVSKTEFLSSSSNNKMKLISIPLCAINDNDDTSTDLNCQGVQFPVKSQQYFGSFSTRCSLGSTTLEKVDDAYTYTNTNDGDSFTKPFRCLRYTSLGKQDVLQVPTIITSNVDNKRERAQHQITMKSPIRVVFLGTYPPRGCGLATFLHDVVTNYDEQFHTNSSVIAIDEKGTDINRVYPSRVIARLNQTERESHLNIAKFINDLNTVDVLNIQHEFGLFGGQAGEWVLHLIATVKKPVLVTFHTVLQDPASIYYSITRAICSNAAGIIVLSHVGRDLLVKVYQVDVNKIHVVPHGIPDVSFQETLISKRHLDLGNRITVATFGLIGRSKGLEYSIRAMKLAVAQVPNLLYIILGATHPVIIKEVGEEYRTGLQAMINNLSLTNNVKLVNKYLDKKELLTYLSAVDIYLTPYPNPDQVVSGTLSIAVGCGKAVVSTPYIYAKELLAQGRGFLVPFKDDAALSQTIVRLATDTELRDAARQRAYKYGRKMIWSRVVVEFARIYQNALLDM